MDDAIKNEYFQLEIAYKQLLYIISENKKKNDPTLKVLLYSAYSRTIQHLWELMKAQVAYRVSKTQSGKDGVVEAFIVEELVASSEKYGDDQTNPQALLKTRERFRSFADDLRLHRNKVSGHVLSEKFSAFPLAEFWSNYHAYVVRLISDLEGQWSTTIEDLASVKEVAEFSKLLTFGQDEWEKPLITS